MSQYRNLTRTRNAPQTIPPIIHYNNTLKSNRFIHSRRGFTLVELIIGMTIFAIGLSGIYALLQSTMWTAAYSRHEIVVANLLREKIELVKNLRDTNIKNYLPWDNLLIEGSPETSFSSWIFLIENNFVDQKVTFNPSTWNINKNTVRIQKLPTFPLSLNDRWNISKLNIDDQWRYVHDPLSMTGSPYAAYVIISPISYTIWGVTKNIEAWTPLKTQWYIIDARVIVQTRWIYREYDAKSMITDWIR